MRLYGRTTDTGIQIYIYRHSIFATGVLTYTYVRTGVALAFIPCTIATYVQCWQKYVCTHYAYNRALTNVDPHEYRGEVFTTWVILELVKQRVRSPLNARGHDKEDLWR